MIYLMEKQIKSQNNPRLLAVLAHPDDESFGTGGTLAYYSGRGVDVQLICATHGDVGEVDPVYMEGFNSKAALRDAELKCAAGKLGISHVHFLNYRDSGMEGSPENEHPNALMQAPIDLVAEEVIAVIQEIKPHVVITFDQKGGYCHPDHVAMHKATVRAFEIMQESPDAYYLPPKLYFHNMPRKYVRIMARIMKFLGKDPTKFGKNGDINLVSIGEGDFPVHAVISYREVFKRKNEASACHASQGGERMGRGITGWFSLIISKDSFTRAYPEADLTVRERCLFEGVDIQLSH